MHSEKYPSRSPTQSDFLQKSSVLNQWNIQTVQKGTLGEVRERLSKTENMEASYIADIYEPLYGERNV